MRRRMMLSQFVLMIAFTFNTTTFAQASPDATTPLTSPPKTTAG
jgi:hypothetical protein